MKNEIGFQILLRNTGEITISEPMIKWTIIEKENKNFSIIGLSSNEKSQISEKIFPSDEVVIKKMASAISGRSSILEADSYIMEWSIYLDNSPPSKGRLDISKILRDLLEEQKINYANECVDDGRGDSPQF